MILLKLKALGDRLPAGILARGKVGFAVPLAGWFRGVLRELPWDHLLARSFLEREIVSEPFLRQLLEEHQSGRRDNHQWLWSLLMLEMWFQQAGRAAGARGGGIGSQLAAIRLPERKR